MTTLKEQLHEDLTAAIKARDELRSATLRLTLASVTSAEVAGKEKRELSDAEVLQVIGKESKKRREAAEAFEGAGRTEQAARERAEGGVLEAYLPKQLTDEELAGIVAAAVAESGASGPQGMGAVMKLVRPQVEGKADGGRVAAAVKAALAG
ncbi:GatB/YqeY domain-containing protein [Kitasatospora sp. NPDC092948]|uniref:GatB/YqeY domain-containing protein n=1 Tax=Kitasatospora sp. NPDC092948 TaxID=3364088 RepID=UPI003817256A